MSVSKELAPNLNKEGRSQRSPSSSFIRISQSSACLAVRMPPAGLKPIVDPVRVSYSRIIRAITTPTGSTAFTDSLPVDVLMKSAPAIIATMLARATLVSVARSPVPRMAFMCTRPPPARVAKRAHFGVQRRPVAGERVCAGDHDVDLLRAGRDGGLHLLEPLGERTESRGEAGGNSSDRNPRALERG